MPKKAEPVPWDPPMNCWWNLFTNRGECRGKTITKRCNHVHPRPDFCPNCSSDRYLVYPCQAPGRHHP